MLAGDSGRLLRSARVLAKLTRRQLASLTGIHHERLARVERGQSLARADELAKIRRALRQATTAKDPYFEHLLSGVLGGALAPGHRAELRKSGLSGRQGCGEASR